MAEGVKIPKRILVSLLDSLSAGVVPRSGAPFVAIGRDDEVNALLEGLNTIERGGSFMKLIIGKYGSGKSFLIQLVRGYAIERGYVCCDADLSPERRICGSKGSGLATYKELIKNMTTKTSPDGNALPSVIAKWISSVQSDVARSGILPSDARFTDEVSRRIFEVTRMTESKVGGFEFANAVNTYYRAHIEGDDDKKSCAMRFLRGEYTTKTEARRDIGAGEIIDDDSWYDYIKLLADFVKSIGYKGLVVFIDECVNLYKITNRISREANYEKLLSMFNDTLQGNARSLGIVLGGTPQFLEDPRRGLFSYDALKSRLSDSRFSDSGFKNLMGPVIRLKRLDNNELYALLARLLQLHLQNYEWNPNITDEMLGDFLSSSLSRAGAETMITPREIIRDFLSLLNILYQNDGVDFYSLIKKKNEEQAACPPSGFDLSDIEL